MDCDKVEAAIREKETAETMIENCDYMGAREKLIKACNLFPALDNISQMITVCDILCTTDFRLPGCVTDWYWVLQTNAAADESHIKSKYLMLTNLLEPIKNKFPGTKSALTLVHKAFSVLSDKEKRSEFDSKRAVSWDLHGSVNLQEPSDLEIMKEERTPTSQSSSGCKRIFSEISDRSNGVSNSRKLPSKRLGDLGGVRNSAMSMGSEVLAVSHAIDEQREKICAQEVSWVPACINNIGNAGVKRPVGSMGSPMGFGSSFGSPSWSMNSMTCKGPDPDYYDFDKNRKAELFAVGQLWAAYDQENMPRNYARINSIGHSPFKLCITRLKPAPVTADERRWCEVGLPVACGPFDLDRSNMVVGGRMVFSHMVYQVQGLTNEQVEIYPQKGEVWAIYRDWQPFDWCSDPETMKGCRFQMVEIITGYSKQKGVMVAGLAKVEGFKSIFQRYSNKGSEFSFQVPVNDLFMFSHKVPAFIFKGGERDKVSDGMFELDPLAVPGDFIGDMAKPSEEGSSSNCSSLTHHSSLTPPISSGGDTRSLKPKWSWKDFTSDQIWAIYDGPDSMPRRYAIVNNVISGTEVCVTFLEPHPMLDDEINWVEENLPFVCGLFRAGRTRLNLGMSQFSHLVKCERSMKKSFYTIYPTKGEIWAVYKNWNAGWKQSDYSDFQCRVVEILSDFSEDAEMRIASLIEVKGCMTFFQRQLYDGFELIRSVSKTEMLCFSHRIPAFIVPGIESHGIPEGSWHLEPDALPPMLHN